MTGEWNYMLNSQNALFWQRHTNQWFTSKTSSYHRHIH